MSDRAQAARSGRKGFKAELEGLRERTRILGHAQVIARLPVPGQSRADPASVAGSVVEAITRATSLLYSAEAGRAAHG